MDRTVAGAPAADAVAAAADVADAAADAGAAGAAGVAADAGAAVRRCHTIRWPFPLRRRRHFRSPDSSRTSRPVSTAPPPSSESYSCRRRD